MFKFLDEYFKFEIFISFIRLYFKDTWIFMETTILSSISRIIVLIFNHVL